MSSKYTCDDPIYSGAYVHDCNKKECYFCYIMSHQDLGNKPERKDGWTSWQLAYLETNYKVMRTERLSEVLNRSANSIWRKIHDLNKLKKVA